MYNLKVLALLPLLFLIAQEKSVPPPGIAVPAAERAELAAGLAKLSDALKRVRRQPLAAYALIFREDVPVALRYGEFFKADEFAKALRLLDIGLERALALQRDNAPWTRASGLVVRGYVSEIDGSAQPFGLAIPASWNARAKRKWRLDAWFHGRGDTLSEVNFIDERKRRPGEIAPRDAMVLRLYGRYCNANRLAGEVESFEALADVKKHDSIDEDGRLVRGFSMGGAGFAEIAEDQKLNPADFADWERKLWLLYDATGYALNFFFYPPLLAYSGEIDKQKQAADIMARHLAREGMELAHVIGPGTEHRYHPDSKVEIERPLNARAARGRDPYPSEVRFTRFTLRCNRMKWLVVDGMAWHWDAARVVASVRDGAFEVRSDNVTALTLDFDRATAARPAVRIHDQAMSGVSGTKTNGSWRASFVKANGVWAVAGAGPAAAAGLRNAHGLQGPVDDAFYSRFVMVRPTGEPASRAVGDRVEAERLRALREWRQPFRGEAREKADSEVTDADIASSNLVLWGDPASNGVLARIAARLPVRWNGQGIVFRGQTYDAATHMPVMIFPNPLNPRKYVVLNSGVPFREADDFTNSRQMPRLPDWAMVDVTEPADGRRSGRVAPAGFFDEGWQ